MVQSTMLEIGPQTQTVGARKKSDIKQEDLLRQKSIFAVGRVEQWVCLAQRRAERVADLFPLAE